MTFTPGSDEGRTDTFEAQTAEPDRDIDKKVEEEFEEAQSSLKTIGEGLYNFGKGVLFLTTGGSIQATQALDALRAKIEGKPFTPPSPNPNAPGIINLEQITTEEAFTRPEESEALPPVTSGPSSSLLDLFGAVTPEQKEMLSKLKMKIEDDEPLDVEAELKAYYEKLDRELAPPKQEDIVVSGAKVRTRRIMDSDLRHLLLKYTEINPDRAKRYVDLNARGIVDIIKTIEYLNDVSLKNTPILMI